MGNVTHSEDRADSSAEKGLSSLPGDGNGDRSSHNAPIATSSKKDLKKQRKRDRKRAKWLEKSQDLSQEGEPEDPSVPQLDTSANPTNPEPNLSVISNLQDHPEDITVTKPDISAFSTEPQQPEYPINPNLEASDILHDHPFLANPDVSSKSTEPDLNLGGVMIAKPDISASSQQHSDPTAVSASKLDLSTRDESGDTLQNTSKSPPIDSDNAPEDTVRPPTEGSVTAVGYVAPRDVSSSRIDLSTPTSSKTVPDNINTEIKGSTLSPNSGKSNGSDSPTEFHTPPEHMSSDDLEHRGEQAGTSEPGSSPNSDDRATIVESIKSESVPKSESVSVTPQTSSALDDLNSRSIATPNITSSTGSIDILDTPSHVQAPIMDKPATDMSQIDDSTNLSTKEPTKTPADELMDTADSNEKSTVRSIRNLPEVSKNPPMNTPTQIPLERGRDDDLVETEHNSNGSGRESGSNLSEEDTEDVQNLNLPVVASGPVSGFMGLKWAYATHTAVDNALLEHGIWLFEKPPGKYRFQPSIWKRQGLGVVQAPVVIDTLGDTLTIPKSEFDNQVLYINSHVAPWVDLRAESSHPDGLLPAKLAQYQAAESMGLNIWRHDRNLLDCRLLSCRAKVADHNPATVICLGCGPKTIIRYCSVAHMVQDLKDHWMECGHEDLVIKRVIDHATAPARFGRLCPAIRDSHDTRRYALYRQGLHAMSNHGRYTLFDWVTEEPTVLVWTKKDAQAVEMERRVERLLNFALFDQRNQVMVGFLYRLLRQCLQLKNSWSTGTKYALQKQFGQEFGLDASEVTEDRVCECEWVGEGLAEALHLPGCRRLHHTFGLEFTETGMRRYLEMYESRYWILRAWQQQHAAAGHWSDRAAGEGFEGEVEGTNPVLGPGWMGWGTEEDDRSL